MKFLVFLCLQSLLLGSLSWAKIRVPTNMNESDRVQALEILGFGTIGKILSPPYPMGGYSGIEVGFSLESVNIDDLSSLGNTTEAQDGLVYPTLSLGKGLYNNFDLFIHFVPFLDRTGISEFGALLRWGFYNPVSIPWSVALVAHGNSVNIDNKIISRAVGANLVASYHWRELSLYSGFGFTGLRGRFVGGSSGTSITDTLNTESESADSTQWLAGLTYNFQPIFIALQIDRFNENVYSAKLGYRF